MLAYLTAGFGYMKNTQRLVEYWKIKIHKSEWIIFGGKWKDVGECTYTIHVYIIKRFFVSTVNKGVRNN